MNTTPPVDPIQEPDENPLLFWVAYLPAPDGRYNYLSDGKGSLRVFKTEEAMREFLQSQVPPAMYEQVVVHSVQGNIIVPYDNFSMPMDQIPSGSLRVPKLDGKNIKSRLPLLPPKGADIIPFDMLNAKPIVTLAPATHPTSLELLNSMENRSKKRRRRS